MGRVIRGDGVGSVFDVCSGLRARNTVKTLVHLGVKLCHVSNAYLFESRCLTAVTETLFYLESRRVLRHHQPQGLLNIGGTATMRRRHSLDILDGLVAHLTTCLLHSE